MGSSRSWWRMLDVRGGIVVWDREYWMSDVSIEKWSEEYEMWDVGNTCMCLYKHCAWSKFDKLIVACMLVI